MATPAQPDRWDVEQVTFPDSTMSDRLAGSRAIGSFEDEELARRECDRLERQMRRLVNPFECRPVGLFALTSFDPGVFCDWLLDAGIVPPPVVGDTRDWEGWYKRVNPGWSDAQRERFWEGLDRLRFYRVVQRPARRTGFVVLEVGWLWCDEPPFYTDAECRRAVEVFSNRRDAERRRRQLEQQRRQEWPADLELSGPEGHDGRLYEVVAIDWEADG